MKVHGILWALAMMAPLCAQNVSTIDKDEFLRHVDKWQLPDYPRKSANERHTGVVSARVVVDAGGHVNGVNVLSSPDAHIAETVKTVIAQWVFKPFMENGSPKTVESTIYIEFRLHPVGPNVAIPGLTKQPEETIKAPHSHPSQ